MSELSTHQSDHPLSLDQSPQALLFLSLECERVLAGSARWALDHASQVSIGRGDERGSTRDERSLTITVPDPRMSTTHARLLRIGGRWLVEDRGSKNGTIVNGRPVMRAALNDGDVVEVGRTVFLFRELPRSDDTIFDLEPRALKKMHRTLRTLSAPLAASFSRLLELAEDPAPILLMGERGSGVDAVARAVHDLTAKKEPLTVLRGAEQDAFSAPERGTLVVHELDALSPAAQAGLLELLGAAGELRVVCTSQPDASSIMPELARLFDGRSVLVPPLRERREDLGILIGASLKAADAAYEWAIEPDAARALLRYRWPDNLHELDAILRAAAPLAKDGLIRLGHLPELLRQEPAEAPSDGSVADESTEEPTHGSMRDELCALLAQHRGNVSAVARVLGRDRSGLRRLLKRLAIDASAFR